MCIRDRLDEFVSSIDTQRRIEIREWLVEQKDHRFTNHGAAKCDALPLAPGERVRFTLQKVGKTEQFGGCFHSPLDLGSLYLSAAKPKAKIVLDTHMGIERVRLKHHSDVAVLSGNVVHYTAINRKNTGGDRFEARNHPQGRRFTAARRSQQDHELAVCDIKINIINGKMPGCAGISFGNLFERNDRHEILYLIAPAVMPRISFSEKNM